VLANWLAQQNATAENAIVCIETTGVYAEALCYFLHEHSFTVSLENPQKVKRAFKTNSNKNDPTDARQIAEYTFRFFDELLLWQPREVIVEQIRTLLAAREQFVSQRTAGSRGEVAAFSLEQPLEHAAACDLCGD